VRNTVTCTISATPRPRELRFVRILSAGRFVYLIFYDIYHIVFDRRSHVSRAIW